MGLAAEALRGVGGVLLDIEGNRFANELGRRDYVTGMMWKNKGVTLGGTAGFFLCLNSKSSTEIQWHCKHYKGRGIMKFYNNMGEFAEEYQIPVSNIDATFATYNETAEKQASDPENGPYEDQWRCRGIARRRWHCQRSVLRWRGCGRHSRKQPARGQLASGLRGLRSRLWSQCCSLPHCTEH